MILLKQRTSTKMMFFLSNYKKIGQGEKNMDKLIIEALNKNSEIKQLKKEQEILLETKVKRLKKQVDKVILKHTNYLNLCKTCHESVFQETFDLIDVMALNGRIYSNSLRFERDCIKYSMWIPFENYSSYRIGYKNFQVFNEENICYSKTKQYELEILLLKNIIKYLDTYLKNAYLDLNEKLDDKAKKIMKDTIRLNSL